MNITRGVIRKAQKILLYAPEGVGKTTFASQFPDPLFIDTEDGSTHLDVARLDKPTSFDMLGQQLAFVLNNKPCKTLVIDTVDWLEMLIIKHVCDKSGVDSIEKAAGAYGKGYTEVTENMGRVLDRLQDIVDAGVHVVLLCHAQVKRHEDPMEMGSYDRYTLKLGKSNGPLVKEWADMVLFANHEVNVVNIDNKGEVKGKNKATGNGKRVMYTQFSPAFDAKNRHSLEKVLPFEFLSIAQHIDSNLVANVQVHVEPQIEQPILTEVIEETVEEVINEQVNTTVGAKETPQIIDEAYDPTKNDWTGVPQALKDLMLVNEVYLSEILNALYTKGIYPQGTKFTDIDPGTVQSLLIASWSQMFAVIEQERLPF